ncbi:NADPH oxidase organizer 1 [Oryzias melastigma]|uniref:NADPH oxidase organizer 1b n=1 Tax=Oryzias melastigma TaxID=30732 RepID=A0A3B3BKN2_ORYME|nr:NADPH oxidase organizer 1 [Oryzias melastigma]
MADEQRSLISARVIGGVRRDTPRLKTFMVSVIWSDGSEIIIYRSFKDFKKFHDQLKKRFPNLTPFRKDDRMLPKFNGKARRSSLKQKGSKKSVRQMEFLESYCDKLLKRGPNVTQSLEVTRFFTPKDHDLEPDFTKNSVMIMVSDDGEQAGSRHFGGNVTHPFVTQTYRCVAPYETKDTKNRPFKVAVDEKLDVLIKDPAGWWLVESEDKRLAWFPAPYLEVLDGEDEDDDGYLGGTLYCAVRSYSTKKNDEVSLSIGSVVEVLRKSDDGWWLIRFSGKVGYIPAMYLQPYNNPRAGLHGLHSKIHTSTLNLSTIRDPVQSRMPRRDSPRQSSLDSNVPARVHKAKSLDVLSEPWLQGEEEAPTPDGRTRSMSGSDESMFSDFSSSSGSSSSLREEAQGEDDDRSSGSNSSGFAEPTGPRVPPRPKAEEILTRCTTMTRKAALATKTRLQIQPESIHSR